MDITFKPSYPSQNTLEMQEQEPTEVIIRRYINQHVDLTPIHIQEKEGNLSNEDNKNNRSLIKGKAIQ